MNDPDWNWTMLIGTASTPFGKVYESTSYGRRGGHVFQESDIFFVKCTAIFYLGRIFFLAYRQFNRIFKALLIFICLNFFNYSEASVSIQCTLKKNIKYHSIGNEAKISLIDITGDPKEWMDKHCSEAAPFIALEGAIDETMLIQFRRLFQAIKKHPSFHYGKKNFHTQIVRLNSEGGEIRAAIRMGYMLRELNSSILISKKDICFSACVLLAASGVDRSLIFGNIGIHRFYFTEMDPKAPHSQVSAQLRALNAEVEKFLSDMNIPASLLDAMNSLSPNEIYIIPQGEYFKFGLGSTDPVFDEMSIAYDGWRYGATSSEIRKRRAIKFQCILHESHSACDDHILYGLSRGEFKRRLQKSHTACEEPQAAKLTELNFENNADLIIIYRILEDILYCKQSVMTGRK